MTPGNDTIRGGTGSDKIFGESTTSGFPALIGTTVNVNGRGNDILDGNLGDDVLSGQVGDDILIGGRGDDELNGGSGIDTADYSKIAVSVFVDLQGITGLPSPVDGAAEAIGQGIDNLALIENVTGSSVGDTLKGDGIANTLSGLAGNDTLNGRGGADILIGGKGQDRLVGGAGNDTFVFTAVSDLSATQTATDIVVGFASGDKFDLSLIDADPASAVSAFTFQTTPLTGAAQVTFIQSGGDTIILGSTDADSPAEFRIVVKGLFTLTAGDFVL